MPRALPLSLFFATSLTAALAQGAEINWMSVDELEAAQAKEPRKVMIDVYTKWCGPCKMIAPILEEIADEQGEALQVAKLNVDEAGDVARRFEVMSIPTLSLFTDGEPVKRIVGAKPKQALLDDIAEFI